MKELKCARIKVLEPREASPGDEIPCRIGEDINFSSENLEQYCLKAADSLIYDIMLLIAAVDYCDRVIPRQAAIWGREIFLDVPVHDKSRWGSNVKDSLTSCLDYLTGDSWRVSFRRRKHQVLLETSSYLPIRDEHAVVLPYSSGLDSRMTAALVEAERENNLVSVRVSPSAWSNRAHSRSQRPFASVPFSIKLPKQRLESSARTRGFRFASLAALAAILTSGLKVIIPESGQGALGPALIPVGQIYPDYRHHPEFHRKVSAFFEELTGKRVEFTIPRLWRTKAETLTEFVSLGGVDWQDTRSCWRDNRHTAYRGRSRQCGVCAACMLRRLSIFAAGQYDDATDYIWEDLDAPFFEEGAPEDFEARGSKAHFEYGIAGVLHLEHLGQLHTPDWDDPRVELELRSVAEATRSESSEVKASSVSLWARHAREWQAFLAARRSQSFILQWISELS